MAEEDRATSQAKLDKDWHPDHFPTSAKPVFRKMGLLVAIIAAFCAILYYSSEDPQETEKEQKKLQVEDDFLADEQLEDL